MKSQNNKEKKNNLHKKLVKIIKKNKKGKINFNKKTDF